MDCGDLIGQAGQADDELADHERQHAADDGDPGQQDQRHRATAGSTTPVQKVDGGNHQSGHQQTQGDRHHDDL